MLTCYNCNEKKEGVTYPVPTGKFESPVGPVMAFSKVCYACFLEWAGFDNEGRPATVQLFD